MVVLLLHSFSAAGGRVRVWNRNDVCPQITVARGGRSEALSFEGVVGASDDDRAVVAGPSDRDWLDQSHYELTSVVVGP